MARTRVFDEHAATYDAWFENNQSLYESELHAIRTLLPDSGKGIEIGAGTGRFSKPLGIQVGIEPSPAMRKIARERGINAIAGIAEQLPLEPATFDYVLFVTTLCFLDSLKQALGETFRILKPQGVILIGFIEKESALGKLYRQRKAGSSFYKGARFYTVDDITSALESTGFIDCSYVQTLFPEQTGSAQAVKEGYGEGAFVVVRATRPGNT
ncbi:MAG: methyltransferase domain-containing protein [Gammaproteobacteria bacterium]|nr:methyltransferase domain-containing protein [Gammaproteobacteria bacterium]